MKLGNITLTIMKMHVFSWTPAISDKQIISNGDKLHDSHINMAQVLLSKQLPDFNGFSCTLAEHYMNGYTNFSLLRKPLDYS